ncbi:MULTISPECIES: hypothetical protein [Actinomycetospora]|uniref:hypothetical protein n=1 Tax=Actinomycetospora TaxID=402649 RepID=UPI001E3D4702|nr:hypothetical protein [Actinomycetospora soli]MCD2188147.1 hypothetical protein [Actinomycetospora soli]
MAVGLRSRDKPVYRVLVVVSLVVLVATLVTLPWEPVWAGVVVGVLALVGFLLGGAGWWGVRWREERRLLNGMDLEDMR